MDDECVGQPWLGSRRVLQVVVGDANRAVRGHRELRREGWGGTRGLVNSNRLAPREATIGRLRESDGGLPGEPPILPGNVERACLRVDAPGGQDVACPHSL